MGAEGFQSFGGIHVAQNLWRVDLYGPVAVLLENAPCAFVSG